MSVVGGANAAFGIANQANDFASSVIKTVDQGSATAVNVTRNGIQIKHMVEGEANREQNVKSVKEHTIACAIDTLRTKFEDHFNIVVCNDYDRDKLEVEGLSKTLKQITVAFGGTVNDVSNYRIFMFRSGKYERGAADIGQPGHRWERDGIQYYGVGGQKVQIDYPVSWMVLNFPSAQGEALSSEEVEAMAVEIGMSASVDPPEGAPKDEDAAQSADVPDSYDPAVNTPFQGQREAMQEGEGNAQPDEGQDQRGWGAQPDEGQDQGEWNAQPDEGQDQGEWNAQPDEGQY
ncbi:hypothetical protein B0O99DRAFT_678237 [Bisporella sp. PMI_857]|nr:hypothetical protein B0O99DRAFT_678237 [Bisporella sp. PMI_857]